MTNRAPTQDEMHGLFCLIGEGIWQLQYLEEALHMSMVMKSFIVTPEAKGEQESLDELQRTKKMTLGTALKNAEKNVSLPRPLLDRFKPFLAERNWLVHNSVEQHDVALYSVAGRDAAIRRLQAFIDEAKALRKLVMQDIEGYARGQGLDVDTAIRSAEARIAKLAGR